ncbi:GntR family transcriptional regulator [Streptomyces drozdowiczii]|uniref:GntR family transcriptional regulator n=1 Tax=Streptomyces drozdowiczii TaxID=202862 RepID=A0ABY6Q1E9_9ACTN|nr:GntR family transcriptional regulator [Streptomyces drozdowiczii]MCX0246399.1 GntR family transcriptional regulator [Streptomyces drozdowiczii]UZK58425.1 GntR family transcriptional regulator [Streptomyces drozdowiczii]
MQVADRIRRRILDGVLAPGAKLPPVRELAAAEGVAVATLGRSLDHLQVEGYITTSRRGTFVADAPTVTASAHDRTARVLRTGSILGEGETMIVTSADLVVPPTYVAEIFDSEPGARVVRRQWHTGTGQQRTGLYVTWYPGHFAGVVPELLSSSRGDAGRLLARVQETTGRRVIAGRDDMHGRDADAREAAALGLRIGAPILAGAHRLWDDEGIIEYGEWCLPSRLVIGYEYRFEQ